MRDTPQKPFAFMQPRIENVFQNKVMQTLEYIGLDSREIISDSSGTQLENNIVSIFIRGMSIEQFKLKCEEKLSPLSYDQHYGQNIEQMSQSTKFSNALGQGAGNTIPAYKRIFGNLGNVHLTDRQNGLIQLEINQRDNYTHNGSQQMS